MTMGKPLMALRQVEIPLPQAFANAVSPELFERLRLEPIPPLFLRKPQGQNNPRWLGFCSFAEHTEFGEIVMDARLVEAAEWQPRSDWIQFVYLHEVAHRLMPGACHNGAFGAMVLLLYFRAGVANEIEMWQRSTLYDFQDEGENLPRVLAWAWKTAQELALTDLRAERCADVIAERYERWCAWLAAEPERSRARQADAQARAKQIADLREGRYWWAAGAFALGAMMATVLQFV